jgi:Ca-activated chloride channel family protein
LERAKLALSQLIDQLKSDRIGVVIFAGDAFMQVPITNDYAAAKLFLSSISTGLIQKQGTDIGNALEMALSGFEKDSKTEKVVIIITDGENHEERALETAREAAENGITIHTIGMASLEGAPIPVYRNGKQVDYRKDREGNTVVSQLSEETLKEISAAGDGIYVRASKSNTGLRLILNEIAGMEKTEFDAKIVTDYEDRFQYFLFPAILCLLLFDMMGTRKKNRLAKADWFKVNSK